MQQTKNLASYTLELFLRLLIRSIKKNIFQSSMFASLKLPSQNIYSLNSLGTVFFLFMLGQCGRVVSALASQPGGPEFESRVNLIICLRLFQ